MSNQRLIRGATAVGLWLALSLLPNLLANDGVWLNWLSRLIVIGAVVLLAYAVEVNRRRNTLFLILVAASALMAAAYILLDLWQAAWPLLITWFTILLLLSRQILLTAWSWRFFQWLWNLAAWFVAALIAGMGLALLNATLSSFAEEEFFTATLGLYLAFFWLILAMGFYLQFASPQPIFEQIRKPQWAGPVVIGSLTAVTMIVTPWILEQYQRSFSPHIAPSYPELSDASPFICGQTIEAVQTIPSEEIKEDLLFLLEANPNKNTLDWGSLALYSGDRAHALEFRRHLLGEATQAFYTSPAHSIKWGQYEAALRIQQLELINMAFPTLFSDEDWQTLRPWFATINQRAMTVEWVDWLYATAYGTRPEGPYENQEIGAGLLAALMINGLSDDELIERNESYLSRVPLGWQALFRNTDDSYTYQGVWLANAWLIYRYRQLIGAENDATQQNMALSLLWMLLLSLPDGESLSYNTHGQPSLALVYVFGAALSGSPELSWLAGKALRNLADEGRVLGGGLTAANLALADGLKPNVGSCLIFGNSGVPIQRGPLGPDKVVLRDGWSDDAVYALLNLRFTGWHRYKATNTLTLLYQDGPLVSEQWTGERFWWLPLGRNAFRDKRAPREYLNGLLLPKSGLPALLWHLSGMGGPWLQDPPPYAEADLFFAGGAVDMSQTTIPNWRGWRHERTIYLIHDGLVLVIDNAVSDSALQPASLIWHVNGDGQLQEYGLTLDNERRSAKAIWPADDNPFIALRELPPGDAYLRSPDWELLYTSPYNNELKSAVAFLTKEYTQGAFDIAYVGDRQGVLANWSFDGEKIALLHNLSGRYLETDSLGTDGTMLLWLDHEGGTQLCYAGGQTIRVRLADIENPSSITDEVFTLEHSSWQSDGDWLTITLLNESETGCVQLHH
jgi:hypothetical protein